MKATGRRVFAATVIVVLVAAVAWQVRAGGNLLQFPENYREGVHYATVNRGNGREELYTSRAAIEAAKTAQPFPSGTVITMEDYRNGRLHRYVVMEKRAGWGSEYPPDMRNGEWEYQAFNPDRAVNRDENLTRCFSCHKSRERQDFVWTLEQMRGAP